MKNFKLVLFLIMLNNFSASQQQCRNYKNTLYYPPQQIYLLESNDTLHREINEQFILENSLYLEILVAGCQLKVQDIIEYSKQFPYLINLYVPDFYKNNYNKVRESLVYSGDIIMNLHVEDFETKVTEVCKSAKIREDGIETCESVNVERKHVKLSTTGILEEQNEEIFEKVLDFQPNEIAKPINLPKVVDFQPNETAEPINLPNVVDFQPNEIAKPMNLTNNLDFQPNEIAKPINLSINLDFQPNEIAKPIKLPKVVDFQPNETAETINLPNNLDFQPNEIAKPINLSNNLDFQPNEIAKPIKLPKVVDFQPNETAETINLPKVVDFQPNVISKPINLPNIFYFQLNEIAKVINFPIKKQLKVIVCDETIFNSLHYDGFNINYDEHCNGNFSLLKLIKDDTLAVLAPKVFNIAMPIDNPVVFYEDSYITNETKDWFRNSVTAVPWKSLIYGFLFFVKKMEWIRVAIISDSSEYSQEFEKDLTTLFRQNGIAYMAETCVTSNCDTVIDEINNNKAKIIIANFDLENMANIAPYAKLKKLVRARNVIWITRDLSKTNAEEAADMLNSEIFNISSEKSLAYILQILNTIRNKIQVNCDTKSCSFSKNEVTAQLKELLKTSNIKITSVTNNHNQQNKVGSLVIENDSITKEYFNYPHHIEDSFGHCTFRNNRFANPCDDTEIVLVMVILTVFFLTVLGVVVFFQSPELETSYSRMR